MKVKRQIIIVCTVLVCLLVGCTSNYENSYQGNRAILDHVVNDMKDIEMPIGDYTYGNDLWGGTYDVNAPFATINVNPFATEEVVDKYITVGTQINTVLSKDKTYRDFIKTNKPYITYECFGHEIVRIDVKSRVDIGAIKKEILVAIEPYRESVEQDLSTFYTEIDKDELLKKDADGNYYYVLDTKNVSESFGEIRTKIDEINTKYPLDRDEVSKYVSSLNDLGNVFGSYSIYYDEYGADKLASHWDEAETTFLFGIEGRVIYNQFYMNHFQDRESDVDALEVYSDLSFGYNNDLTSCINISYLNNKAYTKDEYYKAIYDVYINVYDKYEELGITEFENIVVNADRKLVGDKSDSMHIVIAANIPLDQKYDYDEFVKILDADTYTYDQSEYELEDDCW